MALITLFLVISTLATVAPAAVKRDDYSSSNAASSASSSPVYSASPSNVNGYSQPANSNGFTASNVQYTNNGASGYASPSNGQATGASSVGDHVASASAQSAIQGGQSNGNLYYYYYPVADKNKDSTAAYQGAASNQYTTSMVNSVNSNDASASSHLDGSSSSAASGSPSDLSYSAQDLTYSAQALNPGIPEYSGSAQASSNYDQILSSLPSSLSQQYGFGVTNNNQQSYSPQGNSAPSTYTSHSGQNVGNNAYGSSNYGYDAAAAAAAGGQEQAGQFSASNPVPNYGINTNAGATFIPANGQGGFNPAAAGQGQGGFAAFAHQNMHNPMAAFGNVAQPSMQAGSYEPAVSGYGRRYGIGSFLMPMLALAGLSLLIPTVTSLTASGRKKRSIDGVDTGKDSAFGKYFDRLERYYSIYKTAVEREECMNRIVCELGDAMSGVRGKSPLFS